jgi:hypothetical protein
MFDDVLARVEATLDVPYPDRALVVEEIASDLEGAYRSLRQKGLAEDEARAEALRMLELDEAAMGSLASVHLPAVQRLLARLPMPARDWLEAVATALPLAGLVVFLVMEVPMLMFFREGGFVIYLILGIGALAILLELQRAVIWFILRNHSARALRRNTPTPLYLGAATLALGLLGTALDYYVVVSRWAEGAIPDPQLRIGLKEPLPCLIVAGSMAALIFLLHAALQAGLRGIRVPAEATKESA